MSLQEVSSHLMAGFSAGPQALLPRKTGKKPHTFGRRTKDLRSLMSRPNRDTITAFNAVTRKKMRITHLWLSVEHPTSSCTGRVDMASTKTENQSKKKHKRSSFLWLTSRFGSLSLSSGLSTAILPLAKSRIPTSRRCWIS